MSQYDLEELKKYLPQYVASVTEKRKYDKYNCPLCNSGKRENGTPAFSVYADDKKCHCFSCGFSGNIIDLYLAVNQMTNTPINFGVALKALAGMYGISSDSDTSGSKKKNKKQRRQTAKREHIYHTDNGENFARKLVISYDDGSKDCFWEPYDSDKQQFLIGKLKGRVAPLYHVQRLSQTNDVIYFAEGEKDVERLESWGYTATCTPNGAGQTSWPDEYNQYLNQRDVIIICDNDKAGKKYGQTVTKNIYRIAKSVKIIPAESIWNDCPDKGDISDIANALGDEKAKELLNDAIQRTEIYTPETDEEDKTTEETKKNEAATQQAPKNRSAYDVDGTGHLTIRNLSAYLNTKGYRVFYDEISRRFVYEGFKGESQLHIEEIAPVLIYDELQFELHKCSAEKIDTLMRTIATRIRVNPILDMIQNTVWDGNDRLEEIYQMFGIEDATSRTLFRKWSMQAIAALYNREENPFSLDIVLVFQGKQGISKTRFFEHLAINQTYFGEGYAIDTRNKDSIIEATCNWIVELGEIGSTMRKDMDALKAFLTKSMDEYRQPFARKSLKYPRRTVFVGTVNDERYLIDETGNRRFATIPIDEDISLDYEKQIAPFDSLQFWAQIYSIVLAEVESGATIGGCFRLTNTEKEELEKRNSRFTKPLKGELEVLDILSRLENLPPSKVEYRLMTVTEFKNMHPGLERYSSVQIGKIFNKLEIPVTVKKLNGTNGTKINYRLLPIRKYG